MPWLNSRITTKCHVVSRQKLADAIIDAQEAAGLDQLILVAQDDAFEGKIEHAILLEKSATLGTAMVLAQ